VLLRKHGKTQRENLSLMVATMLNERSANLMSLAAALSRPSDRIDMHYQWIVRVLANPLIECDAVMLPFAREVLGRAQAEAGPGGRINLIGVPVATEPKVRFGETPWHRPLIPIS